MNQRIGVTVGEPPLLAMPAIDLGDAQRPALIRKASDFAVLALDHHQHDQIVADICLFDLQRAAAIAEKAGKLGQMLRAVVKAMAGRTAEGGMGVSSTEGARTSAKGSRAAKRRSSISATTSPEIPRPDPDLVDVTIRVKHGGRFCWARRLGRR